jgi:tryptophan synthase alpha chain
VVPVISPGISNGRLAAIAAERPQFLYTTLRSGITGSHTEVSNAQLQHLQRCRATGAHVMAGFGIESRKQVEALAPHADTLVVGSHFVKRLIALGDRAAPEECGKALQGSIEKLARRNF